MRTSAIFGEAKWHEFVKFSTDLTILLLFIGVFSGSDKKGLSSKAKILPNPEYSRKDLGASAPVLLQIPDSRIIDHQANGKP